MNTNAWIIVGLGLIIWAILMLALLAILKFSRSTKEQDMAADDEEQLKAVSRPAALPHVRAGTAWGKPLQ